MAYEWGNENLRSQVHTSGRWYIISRCGAPTWQNGHYIWTRTKIVYTDGTTRYSNPVCLPSGKGIVSIEEQYYKSTSATTTTGGSWQGTPPTWESGKYIWTRSKITYTDGTIVYTDPINNTGATGATGQQGPAGKDGKDGTNGANGVSFRKINAAARQYTLALWHQYGDPGHSEIWSTSGYDNSHIVIGDTVYIAGKVTDCKDAAGNMVDAMAFGTCTGKSGSSITMYTTNLIIGGTKGDKGDNGGRGPALRGPQDWDALPTDYHFYQGAEGETYKDVVLYGGNFYSCIKTHTKQNSAKPTNSTYWQLADKVEIIASKILLSKYALIEKLGASAIEMKDPNTGQTLFYAKDGTVSCKVGIFENVTVSGTVKGVTGSFKWLDCVDSSGNVVGRICASTSAYGGIAFESVDMVHQGTKDGRSLRFYSSDIWCRGGFSAHHLNVAVVNGSTIKYYTKGPAESTYESKTMTSHTGDGKTYYDIELYSGMSGDASGFPVDLVIINHTYDNYAYRLVGATAKKVTVICSNDYHGADIAFIGGWLGMNGGEARPFVYVGSHYSPTTSRVGNGWFALEGCDNNWG